MHRLLPLLAALVLLSPPSSAEMIGGMVFFFKPSWKQS